MKNYTLSMALAHSPSRAKRKTPCLLAVSGKAGRFGAAY